MGHVFACMHAWGNGHACTNYSMMIALLSLTGGESVEQQGMCVWISNVLCAISCTQSEKEQWRLEQGELKCVCVMTACIIMVTACMCPLLLADNERVEQGMCMCVNIKCIVSWSIHSTTSGRKEKDCTRWDDHIIFARPMAMHALIFLLSFQRKKELRKVCVWILNVVKGIIMWSIQTAIVQPKEERKSIQGEIIMTACPINGHVHYAFNNYF